jgi:hypothetical protein
MLHLGMLALAASLLLPGSVFAACVGVGSQLDCRWPGVAMRFGTQTDPQARAASTGLRMQGFAGPATVGRPLPSRDTLMIGIQSFSDDPHSCRRFGNETYCY